MSRFKNKTEAIKIHLLEKGSITSWDAIQRYQATRLSAIIFNLRHSGMDIVSIPIEIDGVRFSRYVYQKANYFKNADSKS